MSTKISFALAKLQGGDMQHIVNKTQKLSEVYEDKEDIFLLLPTYKFQLIVLQEMRCPSDSQIVVFVHEKLKKLRKTIKQVKHPSLERDGNIK